MRTLYLVRHDTKAWANGRKPVSVEGWQHDPPIQNDRQGSVALQTSIEQLKGVGFDQVFCSPFLRTRQTATLIANGLQKEDKPEIRTELGEYLGNQRRGVLDLCPMTLEYYPNVVARPLMLSESIKRLEVRVAKFVESLPAEGTFLIVSHGLVMSKICGQKIEEGEMLIHTTD